MVRQRRISGFRLATLAGVLLVAAACGGGDGPVIDDVCSEDADCESGLCYEQSCLDPHGDEDGDGLLNRVEVDLGTNALSRDSDGDGRDDFAEVGSVDAPLDEDGDGRIDAVESTIADADGDCLADQLDADDAVPGDFCDPGGGGCTDDTTCPSGQRCGAEGVCEPGCVPDCAADPCGDDGCGGTCAACPPGQACSMTRECAVLLDCVDYDACMLACDPDPAIECLSACAARTTLDVLGARGAILDCIARSCARDAADTACRLTSCADEHYGCFAREADCGGVWGCLATCAGDPGCVAPADCLVDGTRAAQEAAQVAFDCLAATADVACSLPAPTPLRDLSASFVTACLAAAAGADWLGCGAPVAACTN